MPVRGSLGGRWHSSCHRQCSRGLARSPDAPEGRKGPRRPCRGPDTTHWATAARAGLESLSSPPGRAGPRGRGRRCEPQAECPASF